MQAKLYFKADSRRSQAVPNDPLVIENARVAFNMGMVQIFVNASEKDPDNPDVDMYPLSNLVKIEIREGDPESTDRKKVVELRHGQN